MCFRSVAWFALAAAVPLTVAADEPPSKLPPPAARTIDFVRDIQPIFAERCEHCHGPDQQQGYLRLDARAIVRHGGVSGPLLAAGKSENSLLIERVVGLGTEKRMPLEDDPLTDEQIGLLRAWIDQGAKWPDGVGSTATSVKRHWAYVAPVYPRLPTVRDTAWPKSPLDVLVLARLENGGIRPAPQADRERRLRRVSLDLVGLPPSIAEIDGFLADQSPDAYERLVDRLLGSPLYGERWASPWLDAARYADSNGFQRDGHRTIWPYRDYVIRAFNADMPFDQFTIEQIAGDLLPGATLDQQIATGFHRCTTVNVEAGTDEEENRTSQVIDRVNVTGTVWLGTTLECCQCHNHKFDPFSQRDYYRFFAFFNGTPKETEQKSKGSAALEFAGPTAVLPLPGDLTAQRQELQARRQQLVRDLDQCLADDETGLAAWERKMGENAAGQAKDLPANIRRILAIAHGKRNKNQRAAVEKYFLAQHPLAGPMNAEMEGLDKRLAELAPPASLVMTEMATPRMTAIFKRGSFLDPGDAVQPGTPRVLGKLAAGAPQNRLGLARWLVDPANPLTARVQVNRAWSQFFGQGLVASEEDFGTQAEVATHPEVLDWLAVEYQGRGWSQKRIHRQIVESATYQQSSSFRKDLARRDPYNLLLARGPRFRLPAEAIRDNGLAASGLLSTRQHGPPVMPQQPEGIWRVTGNVDNTYRVSAGEDAYRRGVYTVWRRSAPYPSFVTFDAPDRSACAVKRPRSNSPLQALTLLNDPVYVEMAQALADKVVGTLRVPSPPSSPDETLTFAFRTVLTRRPDANELSQLHTIYHDALQRYETDPQAASQLIGKRQLPAGASAGEWSAWFNVAHVLLNLDETITKN